MASLAIKKGLTMTIRGHIWLFYQAKATPEHAIVPEQAFYILNRRHGLIWAIELAPMLAFDQISFARDKSWQLHAGRIVCAGLSTLLRY